MTVIAGLVQDRFDVLGNAKRLTDSVRLYATRLIRFWMYKLDDNKYQQKKEHDLFKHSRNFMV
jgi:hypothetical protein